MTTHPLLLIGPSTRAMAYSAKRAGYDPICLDLFADTDLQAIAPVEVVPLNEYPHGLIERLRKYPKHIPVVYTGGLENHPQVYLALQQQRPVWGYLHPDPQHGNSIRNPEYLDQLARTKAIHRPRHVRSCHDNSRWLIKPRAGAGGRGIRFWDGETIPATHFLEEFIDGISLSASYLHIGSTPRCDGVTEQLIGTAFVHAPSPFSYAGSIGPSRFLDNQLLDEFDRIGMALVEADHCLMGLFGADFILHDGKLYLIEVNPRYTSSIEVLELQSGCLPKLGFHALAFDGEYFSPERKPTGVILGKAIYFAPKRCVFPSTGPWPTVFHNDVWAIPDYADIPTADTIIEPGHPVLTLFAQGADASEVMHRLQEKAQIMDKLVKG